jgi:hypothetical protein
VRPKTLEEITQERDALLSINGVAQTRADHFEMVIDLLVAAGHVTKEKVEQAKVLAMPLTK